MVHIQLPGAELQPWIMEIGLPPQGNQPSGGKYAWVGIWKFHHGASAASQSIDAPGSRHNGMVRHIAEHVLQSDNTVRPKPQPQGFLHTHPRVRLLDQENPVVFRHPGDGLIVRPVGLFALRCLPEPVAAVDTPARGRNQAVAEILRLSVKEIFHTRAGKMYNADAKLQGGCHFCMAVLHPEEIAPIRVFLDPGFHDGFTSLLISKAMPQAGKGGGRGRPGPLCRLPLLAYAPIRSSMTYISSAS